ncbi:MAG: DNA polymerase III subunit delta [Thermoflavifilum sp.]|uniref:DNA polymerase III subunit delta n=1 Tax=Thermoflavifilum sp. TaxID=1968839 RepID=UPI0018A465C1|nr:DNA polymerase III subunit delta [Thermoflavifilum sp.]QOR75353.1 MAG: DNA polymerase III subunit delta [Thermoflavifilum sp.]
MKSTSISYPALLQQLQKQQLSPLYWLEGEEEYYIDRLIAVFENQLLSEQEKDFNLHIFYGEEADWRDVVNACRQYPAFAARQVVILKEAQQMPLSQLQKLETYIAHPLASTIFVVAYKHGKIDGRTSFGKLIREKCVYFASAQIYEEQIPQWIEQYLQEKGLKATPQAIHMLAEHIGNDLTRISMELEKIRLNLKDQQEIDEHLVEQYVGISREYNVFQLQDAIGKKDVARILNILRYFSLNPRSAPLQLVIASLYQYFVKLWQLHSMRNLTDKAVADQLGIHPFFLKQYYAAAQQYPKPIVERNILLLHAYNLKSVGIEPITGDESSLLQEMIFRLIS